MSRFRLNNFLKYNRRGRYTVYSAKTLSWSQVPQYSRARFFTKRSILSAVRETPRAYRDNKDAMPQGSRVRGPHEQMGIRPKTMDRPHDRVVLAVPTRRSPSDTLASSTPLLLADPYVYMRNTHSFFVEPLNAPLLFSHVALSRGYSVNLTGSSLNNPFDDTTFNPASAIGVSELLRIFRRTRDPDRF